MKNLITAEIIKLSRAKSVKTCITIYFIYLFIMALVGDAMNPERNYGYMAPINELFANNSLRLTILSIIVSVNICLEYQNRMLNNIISVGINKIKYFIAKVATLSLFVVLFDLIAVVLDMFIETLRFGFGSNFIWFENYAEDSWLAPLLFMPRSVIWFGMASGIYCSFNISRDFAHRTINNMLSVGVNRTNFYLSHFIIHSIVLFSLSIITIGIFSTGLALKGAFTENPPQNYLLSVMVYLMILLLICANIVSVCTMLTFVVNNFIAAVSSCALYIYFEVLFILLFGEERLIILAKVLPLLSLSSLKVTLYNNLLLTHETLFRLLCSILFISVCTGIGLIRFNKVDYK